MAQGFQLRLLLYLSLTFALLACAAGAGTVTLTGSCFSGQTNSTPYVGLNLSSSGNDSAVNLAIFPYFSGLQISGTTNQIPLMSPGAVADIVFDVKGAAPQGAYAGAFRATYEQGSQTFFAVFPCTVAIGRGAPSGLVYIDVSQESSSRIVATVLNDYKSTVPVVLDNLAPYGFTVTPQNTTVQVPSMESVSIEFNISGAQIQNASFAAAVALSYSLNGTHYGQIGSYLISSQPNVASGGLLGLLGDDLPYIVVGVVVLIILILLIISLKKGGRNGSAKETVHNDSDTDPK